MKLLLRCGKRVILAHDNRGSSASREEPRIRHFHGLDALWAVVSPLDRGEQYTLGVNIIEDHDSKKMGYEWYGPRLERHKIQVFLNLVRIVLEYVTPSCKAPRLNLPTSVVRKTII